MTGPVEIIPEDARNLPERDCPIELIPLDGLKFHERLVDDELSAFIKSFTDSGVFWKPVLADRETGLIVDGHHRVAGLRQLGARRVPCVLLDYLRDDTIRVETWYPAFSLDPLDSLLKHLGAVPVESEDGDRRLARGEFSFLVHARDGRWGISAYPTEVHARIKSFPNVHPMYYGRFEDGKRDLAEKKIDCVWNRRAISKQKVIDTVLKGRVFAPKTTRHILTFQPAKIRYTLDDLKS